MLVGYGKGMASGDGCRFKSVKAFPTREVLQKDANKFRN